MRIVVGGLLALACACGSKSKQQAAGGGNGGGAPPTREAPTCEEAVDHALGVWLAATDEPPPPDQLDAVRAEGLRICREEKWSAEVRRCLVAATTVDGMRTCEELHESRSPERAKTSEAVAGIQKIYEGARSYYLDESAGRGVQPLRKQFPIGDTGDVPALGSCCSGSGSRCAPDAALWNTDVWSALKFSMDEPHYYSYRYVGTATEFTAAAHGDLDCDGVYSTFEMVGSIDVDGNVIGSAGLFKEKEFE